MKNYIIKSLVIISLFVACKKDNYPGPTAGLYGKFIDANTNELVQQDIIRGTQIELKEHGYNPVTPQYLVVKNDGTYENSLLFENSYTVTPLRGNFAAIDSQVIKIQGNTELNFTVVPYIRIKDYSITKIDNKIVAKFKLEQNVTANVRSIGLFAHQDSRVGEPMRQIAVQNSINKVVNPAEEYTLEIDISSNSSILKTGNDYYFRIGAVIDIGEAKYNYVPAVKIRI